MGQKDWKLKTLKRKKIYPKKRKIEKWNFDKQFKNERSLKSEFLTGGDWKYFDFSLIGPIKMEKIKIK